MKTETLDRCLIPYGKDIVEVDKKSSKVTEFDCFVVEV